VSLVLPGISCPEELVEHILNLIRRDSNPGVRNLDLNVVGIAAGFNVHTLLTGRISNRIQQQIREHFSNGHFIAINVAHSHVDVGRQRNRFLLRFLGDVRQRLVYAGRHRKRLFL
jgi:hypothetical protein